MCVEEAASGEGVENRSETLHLCIGEWRVVKYGLDTMLVHRYRDVRGSSHGIVSLPQQMRSERLPEGDRSSPCY